MNKRVADQGGGFRLPPAQPVRPADPESLFRSLRRGPTAQHVQFLWSHQSDLLRSYSDDLRTAPDVALELPTGTGKTLVGLLIAEWRRLFFGERALYICPTRQLCHQVGTHAERYGMRVHVLAGPGDEFPPHEYADYLTGNAVAITTYSGIFNYRPRFTDPGVIVLDDAHAAEGYVSSLWTVQVRRWENPELFAALLNALAPAIPSDFVARMRAEQHDAGLISAIPFRSYWELAQSVRDFLNGLEETGRLPAQVLFPWLMVRDHLDACQVFYSGVEIAIRPVGAPTSTHALFAGAHQRVYMSATLGEGGELERVFGVRYIARVPAPRGWEQQGSGRRLVLFPNHSLERDEIDELRTLAIERRGRALAICPSHLVAERLRRQIHAALPAGYRLLSANDVERTLDPFTAADRAVLLLAGRYDGIDLPDDACRLLVVHGLPVGITLQERFLSERLGATALLRDRIRTRLTQAMGRCTRNANDFAVVLLEDERLLDFCTNLETRRGLHPELQAEMEFGLENSERRSSPQEFLDLMDAFLDRQDSWNAAEQAIVQLRQGRERQSGAATALLQETVAAEVAYVEALWHGAHDEALQKALEVAEGLPGRELSSYRAWWYYLVGVAAWLLFERTEQRQYLARASDLWRRARRATPSSWFKEVDVPRDVDEVPVPDEVSLVASRSVEQATEYMVKVGLSGTRFERNVQELLDLLARTESTQFEMGLERLGTLLGWSAQRSDQDGAPDGIWQLPGLCLLFEAKTREGQQGAIPTRDAQQTAGHAQWARAHLDLPDATRTRCVLVSPRARLATAAAPHANDVFVVTPNAMRQLAEVAIAAMREARAAATPGEHLLAQTMLYDIFRREELLPEAIFARLTHRTLGSLPRG